MLLMLIMCFRSVPTVMLSSVGKLRYSRWRPRWLLRHAIFYLSQYLDSQLRYRHNKKSKISFPCFLTQALISSN